MCHTHSWPQQWSRVQNWFGLSVCLDFLRIPCTPLFRYLRVYTYVMKTPERWRALPRRGLFVSILAQSRQRMSRRHAVTSWRRTMASHDVMTSYCDVTWRQVIKWNHNRQPFRNTRKWRFQCGDLDLWPMTLTFELGWDLTKVYFHTKFRDPRSNGLAVRALTNWQTHTHTHTQKDGTDFIPSTADAGGNEYLKVS